MSYQADDIDIIDYGLVQLKEVGRAVRGPLPSNLSEGGYVCAIGAAQTFGRFVERPFLAQLRDRLGVETLNFGWAGAGPRQHIEREGVIAAANRASVVIVQVMSGRSLSNSYFENPFAGSVRPRGSTAEPIHAVTAYTRLLAQRGEAFVRDLVEETRALYVEAYRDLLQRIMAPKILFWFSERKTGYKESYDSEASGFFGGFPQLVNTLMIDQIAPYAERYVECVSSRGMPQKLYRKNSAEMAELEIVPGLKGLNPYYPSPEMHDDAAAALLAPVAELHGMYLHRRGKTALSDLLQG